VVVPISEQERQREPGADTDPLSAELLPFWCRSPSARAEPHHAQRHGPRLRVPMASALPLQTPRHAASAVGRARPVQGFCFVSEPPTATPSTAVGAHSRLPPSVTDLWRPQSFPHYTDQERLQGVVLGLTQGTMSGRSLHNSACGPIEEHFPGARLRGVATRSTCIITRHWASLAHCPCSSPFTHHRHEIAAAATRRAPSPVW
jgi:hypothetical protein